MWKQKQWKYKNATPKIPKKEEWVRGVSASKLMQTCSNYVKASCSLVAFNIDSNGPGCLGILPLQCMGQHSAPSTLSAHGDFVSDFDFSPHDERRLATASYDGSVKLWNVEYQSSGLSVNDAVQVANCDRKVDCVVWHPYVEDMLVFTSAKTVSLFSPTKATHITDISCCTDAIQSVSWALDGALLATSCKDKTIRILDPRLTSHNACVLETMGHQSPRDSRVIWTGDNWITASGFNQAQTREINVYDCRSFKTPVFSTQMDSGAGILMPFFDCDTAMLFLAGKGDTTIRFYEFTKATPFLAEGGCDSVVQVKGAALTPKRAMNTSSAEVNRLLLLAQSTIVSVSYIVPRKVTSEFYEDLYPDTYSGAAVWTTDEWMERKIREIPKMSLKSCDTQRKSVLMSKNCESESPTILKHHNASGASATDVSKAAGDRKVITELAPPELSPAVTASSTVTLAHGSNLAPKQTRPNTTVLTTRIGKLKNFVGTVAHRSQHIENIQALNQSVPLESDGFAANGSRCAVSLSGAGGQVLVMELSRPGRVTEDKHHVLYHGDVVTDFAWDPFDEYRLACGCGDGRIRIWTVHTDTGPSVTVPDLVLSVHGDRIHCIRYNPVAKDIVASSSFDRTVAVSDISTEAVLFVLEGHVDVIFAHSWSLDGLHIATYCKDNAVRIYSPRQSSEPLRTFSGPSGFRGGRTQWVNNDKNLVVTAFNKQGQRLLSLYDVEHGTSLCTIDVDHATSVLIPYYDADLSAVFLTGRGDTTMYAYELSTEEPHVAPLPSYSTGRTPHQAVGFLSKRNIDVTKVEFAKAYRLTSTTIEPLSFTVPRVKIEFFQNDLFPDTSITWEPSMNAEEWKSGARRAQKTISLCPAGMKKASDSLPDLASISSKAPNTRKADDSSIEVRGGAQTNQKNVASSLSSYLGQCENNALPQDLMEGVDPSEWDE